MHTGSIVAITESSHLLKIRNTVDEEGIVGCSLSREFTKERADGLVGIVRAIVIHTTMFVVEHGEGIRAQGLEPGTAMRCLVV